MTAPGPWDWAQGYLAPTVGTGPGPSYARPTIAGLLNGPLNRPTPIGSDPAMWRSVGGPAIWLANTMNPVSDINDAVTGSERFSQGLLGGSWKEAASGLIDFAGGLLGMAVPGHYGQYKQAVDEGADVARGLADGPSPRTISGQRYIDEEIVAKKLADGDFEVSVSPPFDVDGQSMRVVMDGHHSLEAARRAGVEPSFVEATPDMNDTLLLLKNGQIDDFLAAQRVDADFYDVDNGVDVW